MNARRVAVAAGAIAVLAATPAALARPAEDPGPVGPSTTTDPYVIPVADGVETTALLSAGDRVPSADGPGLYTEGGIPDGLGATRAGRRRITVFENHEWGAGNGVSARRHGAPHAFVSKITLDRKTLEVLDEGDLINPGVQYFDYATGKYAAHATAPFGDAFLRFCSGTLSDPRQFWDRDARLGYRGQLYFANEENGDNGRSFGVTLDGNAKQLPRLGLLSWENTKPAATTDESTVVIGNEDAGTNAAPAGQLWVYTGTKRRRGDAFARAGLTDGSLQVLAAANPAVKNDIDWRATYGKGVPGRVRLAGIDWRKAGADQNADATANGLSLTRIEDGHWDPRHPADYYFVTTQGGKDFTSARDGGGLWRLRLDAVNDPDAGGELTLLLDGSEAIGLNKPDNLAIDTHGNLLIQEDPGENEHVARVLAYRLSTGIIAALASFDPEKFAPKDEAFITDDEESSGIIDTKGLLGDGTFLFDAQVHKAHPDLDQVVEYGQLLRLKAADWGAAYQDGQPTDRHRQQRVRRRHDHDRHPRGCGRRDRRVDRPGVPALARPRESGAPGHRPARAAPSVTRQHASPNPESRARRRARPRRPPARTAQAPRWRPGRKVHQPARVALRESAVAHRREQRHPPPGPPRTPDRAGQCRQPASG